MHRTDRTSSSLPQDEQISRRLFHEYTKDSRHFVNTMIQVTFVVPQSPLVMGRRLKTMCECHCVIPFIRGRRMKKRKEDEEEEEEEVELFWFDEVMQEQLLHLENKNRETCFITKY